MRKRRMRSFLDFWDSALGKAIMRLAVFLAAIAVICFFGKYAFFESCISTLGIHNCTSSAAVGSDSIVAIGALLVAIISLIPLFSIESRVSDAKKEVEQRVYTQLEQSLELVPQAYELLRLARGSLYENRFGDAFYFADQAVALWPRYKQEVSHTVGSTIAAYLIEKGISSSLSINPHDPDMHADLFFDVQHDSMGRSSIRHQALALKGIEALRDWHPAPDKEAEKSEYLAYLYGYRGAYTEMLSHLRQAVQNEEAKERMSAPNALITFMRACNNDAQKIKALGQLLGISIPINKQQLTTRLLQEDWSKSSNFLILYALLKDTRFHTVEIRKIQIFIGKQNGVKQVSATSAKPDNPQEGELKIHYEDLSKEELATRIDSQFLVIAILERK